MQYTNKAEIHEFHILNLLDYNSNSFDYAAYYTANSAAYHATDSATYSATYHAAYSTANSAPYYAADSAAYSAAYHAAYYAARRNQVDIIKNLLEGDE